MRTAYLFHRVRQGTVLHKVPQLDTAVQQEHSLRPYHLGTQLENSLGVMFLSQVAAEKDRLESKNLGLDTSWPVWSRRRVWERERKPKGTARTACDNKPSVQAGLRAQVGGLFPG